MTDQPKPEKPSPIPEAAQPKSAEKEKLPVTDSQPAKPDAASLPVTEKMPPLPTPVQPAPKPQAAAFPRVDTKPVVAPADAATSEKLAAPAEAKPAASVAPPALAKPATNSVAAPEAKPVVAAPVPNTNSAPGPASATTTDAVTSSTTPETKPLPSEAPTQPAAEKPASPPAVPDKTTDKIPETSKEDTLPPGSSQRVTQRFSEPNSAAATVAAGTICPSCGHRNRPGTLICDNCGTNLIAGARTSIGTRDLDNAKAAAPPDQSFLTDTQTTAVKTAGSTEFNEDMVLRIEIEGGATPMLVYPKSEIIMGRRDPNTGTLPDVDLTAYAGYRMGVSRTHASIRLQDKVLNLSDRGSSNGTFLNGNRLTAHHPYALRDGDEIRLGQMLLKIYFQTNKKSK